MVNAILNYWRYMYIPEVDYNLDRIKCDKLIFNYLEYPEPYIQLDKFKEYMDYDYIVILTNDVIVTQKNWDTLMEDLKSMPPIMCGCFNVDIKDRFYKLNICAELPKDNKEEVYDWYNKKDVTGYIKVDFAGFPLMAIRKDIFEQYKFYGSENAGDLRFCKWCKKKDITIVCNTNNRMLHLRYYGDKPIDEIQTVEWSRRV